MYYPQVAVSQAQHLERRKEVSLRLCSTLLRGLTAIRSRKDGEQVHCANLGQPVLRAVQPQNLLVSECGRLLLRYNATCIVGTELVAAGSAGPCSNILGRREQFDGLEACRVVGSDRACTAAILSVYVPGSLYESLSLQRT